MEQLIISAVTAIFNGADERNWPKVQQAMAENVYLDYSSLSGNPAASIPAEQIINAWKSVLPGFDRTHHQLSGFAVTIEGDTATIHFNGKADHFIDQNSWTVEGTYDATAVKENDQWHVSALKLNLLKQSGDLSLPGEAMKRV
ncbi:nuclear transport factor 2 family protein [Chitinophaga niabensis]|uniref:nuclear transport factor 2 family protein n=1 Tax=Chitinophaga niabensis TaxID=536979 RepID=UPI0031BBA768